MISAIVLAAGESKRMGKPKINLPWRELSILGQIIQVLDESGVDEIITVIGSSEPTDLPGKLSAQLKLIRNPHPEETEMLVSLKIGMGILNPRSEAFLVVLGDQPQIKVEVVRDLLFEYTNKDCELLIPSYNQRRGHPWIVGCKLWKEIHALDATSTLRDFIAGHQPSIHYLVVDTNSILKDIDTPEDYSRELLESNGLIDTNNKDSLRST